MSLLRCARASTRRTTRTRPHIGPVAAKAARDAETRREAAGIADAALHFVTETSAEVPAPAHELGLQERRRLRDGHGERLRAAALREGRGQQRGVGVEIGEGERPQRIAQLTLKVAVVGHHRSRAQRVGARHEGEHRIEKGAAAAIAAAHRRAAGAKGVLHHDGGRDGVGCRSLCD